MGVQSVADGGKTQHCIIGGGKEDSSAMQLPVTRGEGSLQDVGTPFHIGNNQCTRTVLGKAGNLIGVTGETVHRDATTTQVPRDPEAIGTTASNHDRWNRKPCQPRTPTYVSSATYEKIMHNTHRQSVRNV